MEIGTPTAGHFIYIPVVLLLGIVIGWVLGSRAAADAMAMERKRESGERRAAATAIRPRDLDSRPAIAPDSIVSAVSIATYVNRNHRPIISRCAKASGSPASRIRAWVRSTG